jgi:hypothetical protein
MPHDIQGIEGMKEAAHTPVFAKTTQHYKKILKLCLFSERDVQSSTDFRFSQAI